MITFLFLLYQFKKNKPDFLNLDEGEGLYLGLIILIIDAFILEAINISFNPK